MTTHQTSSAALMPAAWSRFSSWWLGELAGLVEVAAAPRRHRRIILFKSSAGLDVHFHRNATARHLGRLEPGADKPARQDLRRQLQLLRAGAMPAVLRLAPDQTLEKTVCLPAAAEDVLEPVLRNQIERHVPWPPCQTRFAYEITGRDEALKRIDIRIIATSQALLDEILAEAADLGLAPRFVEQADTPAARSGLLLLDAKAKSREKTAKRLGRWLGAAMALALITGAAGVTQLLRQQHVLAGAQNEIAAVEARLLAQARARAKHVEDLRQRSALVIRKTQAPSVAATLESLSHALPDDAWLTALDVDGRVLRLQGRSKNSADLIKIIEGSKHFQRARFSAPTTRDARSGSESFAITAELVPGAFLEDR